MFMPPRLELFVFPPLVLPPLVFVEFVLIGVGVLIGVDDVFMVVLVVVFVVVLLALFAFSLPQPIPRAATASKVRRARVLRIELSPVTQRGQIVRELKPKFASVSAGMLPLQLGQLFEPYEISPPQPKCVSESNRTGQPNYSLSFMPAMISVAWRAIFNWAS